MIFSFGLSNQNYTESHLSKLGLSGETNYVFAMQWYKHPGIQNFLLGGLYLVPLSYLIVFTDEKIGIVYLNVPFAKPTLIDRNKITDLSITEEDRKFYSYDGYLLEFTNHWDHYKFLVRRSFRLRGMERFTINTERLFSTINEEV